MDNQPLDGTAGEPGEPPGRGFWAALVRHGVIQASAAYLVFGWLLIQVADATFENLGLPGWSGRFVTFVVVGGFPLVVLLSWFLESADGRMSRDHGAQVSGWLQGLERNYLAIVAAYALAVLGAGIYQFTIGFAVEPVPGTAGEDEYAALLPIEPNSVAVLNFLNLDGSERSQLFSDGLSEDILDRLAMVGTLSVASRSDTWSLPEDASSADVRRRLRVAYFVEGSVRLIDDRLRVVAQLIDSATGRHVISRNFERDVDDFLGVQREITQLVVSNLRVALPDDGDFVPALGIDDAGVDTYMLYQRGREALNRPMTRASLEEALAMFGQALARDPGFAVAHAGNCNAFISLYELDRQPADIARAEQACAAARAASARLPDVYSAIGRLRNATGDAAAAASAYEAALELNPQSIPALVGMADVHQRRGQFEAAERNLERAIELQPGNWRLINSLATMAFDQGRYADAAREWQRSAYLEPDNYVLQSNLGGAQILAGEFAAARQSLESALAMQASGPGYSNLGIIHYCLGDYAASAEMHRKAIEVAPRSDASWASLGDALYFLDRPEDAAAAYARAGELAGERLRVNPQDVEALTTQAWARAMAGDIEQAQRDIRRALAQAPDDPYTNYYQGLVLVRAGAIEPAAQAIARAAELGYPLSLLAVEPHLEPLRGEPAFARLIDHSVPNGEEGEQ